MILLQGCTIFFSFFLSFPTIQVYPNKVPETDSTVLVQNHLPHTFIMHASTIQVQNRFNVPATSRQARLKPNQTKPKLKFHLYYSLHLLPRRPFPPSAS
ncbi:hypothetical protein B9Z19DRAFT_260841 [Tuber borchii]|uniref:Uncharacterized protein n=1 Tax=Tuber borchii TaxID=42251 RepID=A0A2T6ZLC9_TUBBO|nr:hypothetical protein B9Z19DRAFT_260841 [Tuber borchii]